MERSSGKQNDRTKVAVVGTGMAGLVTAWLLNGDPQMRYEVELFESVSDSTSFKGSYAECIPGHGAIFGLCVGLGNESADS